MDSGLPPPPRYPIPSPQLGPDGKPISFLEVLNKFSTPEAELLLGEGNVSATAMAWTGH